MKKIILILLAIFVIIGLCWVFLWNGLSRYESFGIAKSNNENIAKLKIGMSKNIVLQIMGVPQKVEAYSLGNQVVEFIFYRTKGSDLFIGDKEDNFLPIAIDNQSGMVINWGMKYYRDVSKQAPK